MPVLKLLLGLQCILWKVTSFHRDQFNCGGYVCTESILYCAYLHRCLQKHMRYYFFFKYSAQQEKVLLFCLVENLVVDCFYLRLSENEWLHTRIAYKAFKLTLYNCNPIVRISVYDILKHAKRCGRNETFTKPKQQQMLFGLYHCDLYTVETY